MDNTHVQVAAGIKLGFLLGYILLPGLAFLVANHKESTRHDQALSISAGTNAFDAATDGIGEPRVCLGNASQYLQEGQPTVSDELSFQPRNRTADNQKDHSLKLNTLTSSTTGPAHSSSMLHVQLPVETSDHFQVNVLPTRYITIHTTRTKTVTSYLYSVTEASSTAFMHETCGSRPTFAASTCAMKERPSMPLASTCAIDEIRLGPAPSTCGLHDHPLHSMVSTCGLNERPFGLTTSTYSLESRVQSAADSTCAPIERPDTV